MKTYGIIAAAILIPAAAMADTIVSPDAAFLGVPGTFQSTTGVSGPYWNNKSSDGTNMNAGDFLTGMNAAMGSTDYLGTGGAFGNYLSTGAAGLDATSDFSFISNATSAQVLLLYSNAGANYSSYGTEIGMYNLQDPSQKQVLFAHGTLYNPDPASGGVYDNDLSPQTPFTVHPTTTYGIYATSCGFNSNGSIYCDTYYSDSSLDQSTEATRQHFAVFQNPEAPLTYYIAFEDSRGWNNIEGYGDYNDDIFSLQTTHAPNLPTATPEPSTWTALGLGLVGIGLLRRRMSRPAGSN
jgi:hypothetical protein